MKTPRFWQAQHRHHPLSLVLRPLSWLYHGLHRANTRGITPELLPTPILCIGNATAGGAGKTPTVIMLAKLLQHHDLTPHALSRGYGGKLTHATRVDVATHSAEEVGDEPLLIAQHLPCWVARRRKDAAVAATAAGANLLIMDDGLQNPSLIKTLTLMVIDGGFGFGNGLLLPAGPLREPLEVAFAKTDGFLIIGDDSVGVRAQLPHDKPSFHAHITPHPRADLANKRVFAFAGIARPQKFYDTLRSLGAHIVGTRDFSDHQLFSTADLQTLQHDASKTTSQLITTEKDAVRLPPAFRQLIEVLPVSLECDTPDALTDWILTHIKESHA